VPTPLPFAAASAARSGRRSGKPAPFGSLTLAKFAAKKRETEALANRLARDAEAYAKKNAPWTDRTRRARERLSFVVHTKNQGNRTLYVVEGRHGIWYGYYLEHKPESNGGRPILRPTMDAIMPPGRREFRDIWRNTGESVGLRRLVSPQRRAQGPTRRWVRRNLPPGDQ
jgi:hypothetical protein